jgi:ankyrin repeat protein/uncharacterized protein YecT (DUF1311 family)
MRTWCNWVTRTLRMAAILGLILLPGSGFSARLPVNEQLLRAAEIGSVEQVKTLLAKGGDVNAKTQSGQTVLMAAAKGTNAEIVKLLINKGADVNAKDTYGQTALSFASARNQPQIVKQLRNLGAVFGISSAFAMAAEEKSDAAVEKPGLLKEFHLSSGSLQTPKENFDCVTDKTINLVFAPRNDKPVYTAESRWHDPDDREFRVIRRAYDRLKETKQAIEIPKASPTRVHSIPTKKLYNHKPGRWTAALYIDNQLAGRQTFMVTTSASKAPPAASFDCRKATSDVEKMICSDDELLRLDASLNKAYLRALKRTGIKKQMINSQRHWLKNERSTCHNAECIKKAYETRIKELGLSSHGIVMLRPTSLSTSSSKLNNEMLQAAGRGHLEQVKTFLAKGGDVNARNKFGETVMMAAAMAGNLDLVRFLIDKGADVNAKDEKGRTALSLAYAANKPEVVEYLKAHHAK